MASLKVETPPASTPVTLTRMKNYLRLDNTDDDDLVGNILLPAATRLCETFTRRCFCFTDFVQGLDSFPYYTDTVMSQSAYPPSYYALPMYSTTLWNYSQMIKLLRPPLVSVNRISYLASDDQQWHDLTPVPVLWYPGTATVVADLRMDNNGNIQKCTGAGTTGANPPVWNTEVTGLTTEPDDPQGEGEGPVVWQNMGPLPDQHDESGQPLAQFGSYLVDAASEPGRIFPGPPGGFWPPILYVPDSVQIHFTAGYSADGSKVPLSILMAIMQTVAGMYENREAAMLGSYTELPQHCKALLWNDRVEDYQPTRG